MSKKTPKRKHQPVKARVASPGKRKVRKTTKKASTSTATKAPKALPPTTSQRERAVAFLRFAHKMLSDFTMGFADEQLTAQAPGAANHVLWTLGHIAHTNDWIATKLDGQPMYVPDTYGKLFDNKSTPVPDPNAYPDISELRGQFDATFDRLVAAANALDDTQAAAPVESGGGFILDKLDGLYKAAWHESWHLGQIADLRRALGLPRVH
jgi:hypothetical protein